ncbi:MAG: hypothetical protein WCO44_12400 [Bacteroidota bacterium]
MGNLLEYTLSLKDQVSSKLSSIGANSDAASFKINGLRDHTNQLSASMNKLEASEERAGKAGSVLFAGMSGFLGAIGISSGIYAIGEQFTKGIEKAHELHAAEAQLANTMQNMGTFSQEAYEKAVEGSGKLASHIKFSKGDVVELQAQLRMVGNVSENEMNRMVTASADMATKFKMGLLEAGNSVAKAVNNPEMMRRLAMQLKIDPDQVKHIQDLAKHGKEAQARLELLDIVEQKIGGSAKAAFDADPTARFQKAMGKIQMTLGEIGIGFQTSIMPAVEWFADAFIGIFENIRSALSIVGAVIGKLWNSFTQLGPIRAIIDTFRHWWDLLNEGNPIVIAITALIGTMLAVMAAYSVYSGIATAAVWLWNTAQVALNATIWANPITWIIAGVIALIAAISYVIYKIDGWGQLWDGLIQFMSNAWSGFKQMFVVLWLEVQDKFMTGVEFIERGWFRVKSLWDKDGADAGLAKLNAESSKRSEELAAAHNKLSEYQKLSADGLQNGVGALHWNSDKSLGDVVTGLKDKLGIGHNKIEPGGIPGMAGKDKADNGMSGTGSPQEAIATGGTRNTTININLKNMVENIVFDGSLNESRSDLEKTVTEIFMRVLGMAQSTS